MLRRVQQVILLLCWYFFIRAKGRTDITGLKKDTPEVDLIGSSHSTIQLFDLNWDSGLEDFDYFIFEVTISEQDMEVIVASSRIKPLICYGVNFDPEFSLSKGNIGAASGTTSNESGTNKQMCLDGFNFNQYWRASGKYSIDVDMQKGQKITIGVYIEASTPVRFKIKARGKLHSSMDMICAFDCGESDSKNGSVMCSSDRVCVCAEDRIDDDCSVEAVRIPNDGTSVEVLVDRNALMYSYFVGPTIQQDDSDSGGSIASSASVCISFRLNSQFSQAKVFVSTQRMDPLKLVPTQANYYSQFTIGSSLYSVDVPFDQLYNDRKEAVRIVFGVILSSDSKSMSASQAVNSVIIYASVGSDDGTRTIYKVIFYGLFGCSALLFLGLTGYFCVKFVFKKKKTSQEQMEIDQNLRDQVMIIEELRNQKKMGKLKALNMKVIEEYMPLRIYEDILKKLGEKNLQQENSSAQQGAAESALIQDQCVVCLGEFEKKDMCRVTVCQHVFHKDCLEAWLKKQENCPSCRTELSQTALEKLREKKNSELGSPPKRSNESIEKSRQKKRRGGGGEEEENNENTQSTCGGVGVEGVPLRVIPTMADLSSIRIIGSSSVGSSLASSPMQLKLGNRKNFVNYRSKRNDDDQQQADLCTLFGETTAKKVVESQLQSGVLGVGELSMIIQDHNNTADITQLDHSSIAITQDKSVSYTKH